MVGFIELDTKIFSQQLISGTLNILVKSLNRAFRQAEPTIRADFSSIIERQLRNSTVYENLISGGRLRGILGLTSTQQKLNSIIETIKNSVRTEFKPIRQTGLSLTGSFIIRAVEADFQDILKLPESQQIAEEHVLNWLEWLLVRGGSVIIADFGFLGVTGRGRTGRGIMVRHRKPFQIPAEFAGTPSNNWITRAMDSLNDKEITEIIENNINKHLR